MSNLPHGWSHGVLADVLDRIEAGRSFGGASRPAALDEWGIIKVSAMTWGYFKETENKHVDEESVDSRFEIREGDILVSRANTESYVGAPVLVGKVRPKLLLSDKSLRLVPQLGIDHTWLVHVLASPATRSYISRVATGTKESMRNISQAALMQAPIIIPPTQEQRRLATETGERLTSVRRLEHSLLDAQKKVCQLQRSILADAIPTEWPKSWQRATVTQAGRVDLGRQRHPDWHHGPNMKPYLRVANVFEDRIDLGDVMQMHFTPQEFERFRLEPGDILLNEGQSPEYLGRPAMYVGEPSEVAFTNSLLRFRANPDVLPEWALLVFRRHMHTGRFVREVRITTNIAHLSAGRFKTVEFPIPPLAEQRHIVDQVRERLTDVDRMRGTVQRVAAQASQLRRSVLADAFTGRLVPQDPTDEPASVLLQRIHAGRPAASGRKKRQPTPS